MAAKNALNQENLDKTDLEKPQQAKPEQAKPEGEKPATQHENSENTAGNGENAGETPQALAALAAIHRVPGWQQAALTRLMGWEEGKMVTNNEFCAALDALGSRKQGGGRR